MCVAFGKITVYTLWNRFKIKTIVYHVNEKFPTKINSEFSSPP